MPPWDEDMVGVGVAKRLDATGCGLPRRRSTWEPESDTKQGQMAYRRLSFGINDESHDSSNTMPDISLGSLEESFKSPPRSLTTHPPPLSLLGSTTMTNSTSSGRPSTPKRGLVRRGTEDDAKTPKATDKKAEWLDDSFEEEDGKEGDRKWESDNPNVARLARSRSGTGAQKAGVNMTLREQEKVSCLCSNMLCVAARLSC